MSPFSESIFGVFIGTSIFNVDIKEHSCTCRAREMFGIPCEHACAVIGFNRQNVADFVDDQFKLPTQYLIYPGFFRGIETHDMVKVNVDGAVRDVLGNEYFSLNPQCSKRPPGRPSLNFRINAPSIVHVVIWPGIIEKHANILLPN